MDKVFEEKGIIFKPNEYLMGMGPEYDEGQTLVAIIDKFIIVRYDSAVLDPELKLYDRKTLKFIGQQLMFPEISFGDSRTWMSWVE